MTEWRPIETAPKDGTHILVYVHGRKTPAISWYCEETGLWPHANDGPYTNDGEPCNVGFQTHWMPLPEPPPPTGIDREKTDG